MVVLINCPNLGIHRAAFVSGSRFALHAFAGNVRAAALLARLLTFVDLVEKTRCPFCSTAWMARVFKLFLVDHASLLRPALRP